MYKLKIKQSLLDLNDRNFISVENVDLADLAIISDTSSLVALTNIIKISQKQDAYHALKELEGVQGISMEYIRGLQKRVLNAQIDFYISNKEERKTLEAKINSKKAELSSLGQSQELTKEYIEQKRLIEENLSQMQEGKLSPNEALQKKQFRIQNRIQKLNTNYSKGKINSATDIITKYTWSEPIYSMAILQSIILLIVYLLTNDFRIGIVAIVALLIQLLLAAVAHESEFSFLKFMSRNTFDESKITQDKIDPEESELLSYFYRKALESEIMHLEETIKVLNGNRVTSVKSIEEEITQIEASLEKLEAQTFMPEVYLQKRSELAILDMEEVSEEGESLTILVIHDTPESVSFAAQQNNFLQALEKINVFYIASNSKFKI